MAATLSAADRTKLASRMRGLGYGPKAVERLLGKSDQSSLTEKAFVHVDAKEEDLMKTLHSDGYGVKKIAGLLRRSTDTVSKHVFKKLSRKTKTVPKGRPRKISPSLFSKMLKEYEKLLKKSVPKEVTVAMLKEHMGLEDISEKTISRAFWDHDIHFKPLYEKPDLSPADMAERKDWCEEHSFRSPTQWNNYVHAVIDNKVFPVFVNHKFRAYAAKRSVRGAYRGRRRKTTVGHVKPKKSLKENTGQKSVMVTCAIGNGKVLMWHVVAGRWNANAAADMYAGPLRRCLEKEYPNVRGNWRVLEDNDPTGYKSKKGDQAKSDNHITAFSLPKRSPDLNPLDFSFWAAVNAKMRVQERKFPKSKTETRAAYINRLRRTAKAMPSDYINKIIGAIAGRCQQIANAKGGHIVEGN